MPKLTKEQAFDALKGLGEGWHSTTDVVQALYGAGGQKYNRKVYNVLFSHPEIQWDWESESYHKWRIIEDE